MRCFLDNSDNKAMEPSNIYYMELINEYAGPCAVWLKTCYDTKEQDGWVLLQDGDAFGQFKEFANQMAQNDTIWSLWFNFILLLLHVVFGNP